MSGRFQCGDFVYYNKAKDIGQIFMGPGIEGHEAGSYQIRYVQNKELTNNGFWGGGSGPVWEPGYPQPVTDPQDVLFCKAAELRALEYEAGSTAKRLAADVNALMRARNLLGETDC